jgi:hypothetical protein
MKHPSCMMISRTPRARTRGSAPIRILLAVVLGIAYQWALTHGLSQPDVALGQLRYDGRTAPVNLGRANSNTAAANTAAAPRPPLPFYRHPLFILTAAGFLLLGARIALKLSQGRQAHTATGRLASVKEQLERYDHPWARGGYMLGRLIPEPRTTIALFNRRTSARVLRLKPEQRLSHVLIQAGPDAGKTTAYFIPPILEDAFSRQFNVYFVDRKSPEIYQMCSKTWEDLGHRVIYFDPWRPQQTYGFEPLWGATDEQIEAMVQCFVTVSPDPESALRHFRELERRILRAVFRSAQEWGRCTGPAPGLRCRCTFTEEQHVINRDQDPNWLCGCRCRRHFATLPAAAQIITKGWRATRAAIHAVRPDLNEDLNDLWEIQASRIAEMFAGLAGRLQLFLEELPARAFSRRDFTIDDIVPPIGPGPDFPVLGPGPRTILIVGAPQSQGDMSTVLASLMTQLIAKAVYVRRDEMAARGIRWQQVVPLVAMLDEVGTYNVPGLATFIATARSGAAGVVAALQNEEQLGDWYGKQAINHMITNFRCEVYLRGTHAKVAEALSERTGKKVVIDDIKQHSRQTTAFRVWPGFTRGGQERPIEVPALRGEEIEFMPHGQAIVVGPTLPARVSLVRYFDDPRITEWVEQSQQEVARRYLQNRDCDLRTAPRPAGEPRRLRSYAHDWSLIPGVMDAVKRDDDSEKPCSSGQRSRILAKVRDLGLKDEIVDIIRNVAHETPERLSKAGATRVLNHLEALEKAAAVNHGAQFRSDLTT